MEREGATRRSFLSRLFAGTVLAGIAGTIVSALAYLFPRDEVTAALGPQRVKVGTAAEVPPGRGRLALVQDEPVWIVQTAEGFVGMSAWCTHKGCVVKWEGERRVFTCPCHEGLFDEHGNVLSGLPRRPLKRFRVGVVDGDLYVSHRQSDL